MANKKAINADLHHMQTISFDKEMIEVGLFRLLYNVGIDLIVLSLIYFMYTDLQYAVWQIFGFYFVWQFSLSVTLPFVGSLIRKIGLKHSMALAAMGNLVLFLPMPYLMSENFWQSIFFLFPLFLLRSVGYSSFCIAYDIFLSHHLNKESKGSVLAWIQIAIALAGIISPLLGAAITHFWGFEFVTYGGALFFLLGIGVLFITPDEKVNIPYSSSKLIKDTTHTSKFLFLAEFGRCFFDGILWIVWPVFLILVIGDLIDLGWIISLSSALSMALAYFVGKTIDTGKKSSSTLLKSAAYRSTFLNFLRAVWIEPVVLSLIDSLNKLNNQTIQIPYDVEFYKWLNNGNTLEKAHIRRIISENIYTVSMLLFGIIFFIFSSAPIWVFIVIFGLGALTLLFLSDISLVIPKNKK
jgi:MFS family permease